MDNLLDEQKQESKKYNKIQWLFVVIVIPSIFAFMVAVIVASFAGVDVWGKAKELSDKIPFVTTDKEKVAQQKVEQMEKRVTELNTEIQFRDDTIAELETEMDGKEQEIQNLTLEKEELEMQIDELMNAEDTVNKSKAMNEITRTFESMSAKKAAPIIESMNENDALTILFSLKSDTLAGLLENMSPDVAAKFTTLLSNNSREQ
jgi:flagellar motility protein MotE (MotC chaperone)